MVVQGAADAAASRGRVDQDDQDPAALAAHLRRDEADRPAVLGDEVVAEGEDAAQRGGVDRPAVAERGPPEAADDLPLGSAVMAADPHRARVRRRRAARARDPRPARPVASDP